MDSGGTRLRTLLEEAVRGHFPKRDGGITFLHPGTEGVAAILAFSAHHVVVSAVKPEWLRGRLRPGDFLGPLSPSFLVDFGEKTRTEPGTLDVLLGAEALVEEPRDVNEVGVDESNPRVARALRWRTGVRQFAAPESGGVLVMGRGLGGRLEAAIEVPPARWNGGIGRRLARDARRIARDEPVYMQTAPGNASSLRAILAGGFAPLGGEILFRATD